MQHRVPQRVLSSRGLRGRMRDPSARVCAPPAPARQSSQENPMTSSRPVRTLLAAALAFAAAPALAQQASYSDTVFFGDSLTDAGYFRPLLPPEVRGATGQFTTNPGFVWAQWVADHYGT